MKKTKCSSIGFVFGAALVGVFTGCVGYVEEPRHARVYAEPPPVYVESGPVQDDYVYYPGYQVYYSNSRRQYRYQEGHSWVWRPSPPRVSAEVLFAAPSVRVDFHDAPERHHATVVRQYPKNWAPPGAKHDRREGRDEGRDRR
jgi:hypothetical protein